MHTMILWVEHKTNGIAAYNKQNMPKNIQTAPHCPFPFLVFISRIWTAQLESCSIGRS